jgi:type I restriction enzyme, S subunit
MDLLLENFKYLTASPKNVEQLKKLVLQFAVQGKLTVKWREENPDVESASILLEKIISEKRQLIRDKIVKEGKKQVPANRKNISHKIPQEWRIPDLDDITQFISDGTHLTPNYVDHGRMFLSAQNIKPFKFMPDKHKFVSEDAYQIYIQNRKTEKGDLLLGRVGAGIGETAVVDQDLDFAIYVSLALVKTFKTLTSSQFLAIVFNSPFGVGYAKGNVSSEGGSAGNFNLGHIRSLPIPFPPLAEQHAIVSKVESLFSQIDQLHELASKKAAITDNSAKALFGKINTITDKQDLHHHWQLLTRNFNTVTQSKEGVNQLRQTILQLAFQGKLTTKWRLENADAIPASTILEEINAEKQQLIKEGKLRKELHVHKIAQNEQLFKIPESWEWDRMGAISQHNSGKTLDSGRNKGTSQNYITTSNLYWGYFKLDNVKSFLISDNELDRCSTVKGDLLICEGGEAGRTAVWEESYSICFQNHIHRVRLYGNINPYFVFRYFQKLNFSGEINEYRKGMGISNMSSASLASIPIPIPPIAEQEVIVTNINGLMSLCDELENKIEKRDSYQERIMQAVVKQAFVV